MPPCVMFIFFLQGEGIPNDFLLMSIDFPIDIILLLPLANNVRYLYSLKGKFAEMVSFILILHYKTYVKTSKRKTSYTSRCLLNIRNSFLFPKHHILLTKNKKYMN